MESSRGRCLVGLLLVAASLCAHVSGIAFSLSTSALSSSVWIVMIGELTWRRTPIVDRSGGVRHERAGGGADAAEGPPRRAQVLHRRLEHQQQALPGGEFLCFLPSPFGCRLPAQQSSLMFMSCSSDPCLCAVTCSRQVSARRRCSSSPRSGSSPSQPRRSSPAAAVAAAATAIATTPTRAGCSLSRSCSSSSSQQQPCEQSIDRSTHAPLMSFHVSDVESMAGAASGAPCCTTGRASSTAARRRRWTTW